MILVWILLCGILFLLSQVFLMAFIAFRTTFYCPPKKEVPSEATIPLPKGKEYEPFHEEMVYWIQRLRALPYREVSVTSFDGLTLRGKFYEYAPGAPIEVMFHGYKGNPERDLCGGVFRCFDEERSALVVDHRGSGRSEGRTVTFGIYESRDCVTWINYVLQNIDPNVKIILTGVSMGASTVMISASRELPPNVIGVIADCGYTSAKDIIKRVIGSWRLPADLFYPVVKLGAKLFGKFDLDETSPIESMKHCRIPVLFFHGEGDTFVPPQMSLANYEACTARKRLVTVKNAGHALSFPSDKEQYCREIHAFFDPLLHPSV